MHPIKAHNAVAALAEMYSESLEELLKECTQLKAALQQKERQNESLSAIIRNGRENNNRLIKRVAELESAARTAREGEVRAPEGGPGVGDAGGADDRDGVHAVQGDVEDDVRDGTSPPSYLLVRDSAPPQGSDVDIPIEELRPSLERFAKEQEGDGS